MTVGDGSLAIRAEFSHNIRCAPNDTPFAAADVDSEKMRARSRHPSRSNQMPTQATPVTLPA